MAVRYNYRRVFPDVNGQKFTPEAKGYIVEVFENEGAVGFQLLRTEKKDSMDRKDFNVIVMNPNDAEEFISALREATDIARADLNGEEGWAAPACIPSD